MRKLLGVSAVGLGLGMGLWCVAAAGAEEPAKGPAAPPKAQGLDAEQALERLKAGHARFVSDKEHDRPLNAAARKKQDAGQQPFAAVLTCADSRLGPEIIFDQDQGDLFVVRVAGNIADPHSLGSLEYAVAELKVPLVMVLGHSKCGAVAAGLQLDDAPGNLGALIRDIAPVVKPVRGQEDALSKAVEMNVDHVVAELTAKSDVLAKAVKEGKLKIVGAVYELGSGDVEMLEAESKDKE